jgi:hypothetical protein
MNAAQRMAASSESGDGFGWYSCEDILRILDNDDSASIDSASTNFTVSTLFDRKHPYGLVCSLTSEFRMLAAKVVTTSDLVVEIGSSWGHCTNILAKSCGKPSRVLGLEISKEAVVASKTNFPSLTFEFIDVFREPRRVLELVQKLYGNEKEITEVNGEISESPSSGPDHLVVFVDIGGNRDLRDLVALLPWVLSNLCPQICVVKSESLHAYMKMREIGSIDVPLDYHKWSDLREFAPPPKPQRLPQYPLKAPLRHSPSGVPICRFYNYDTQHGCIRLTKGRCPLDHEHCHMCGVSGHRAFDCTCQAVMPIL